MILVLEMKFESLSPISTNDMYVPAYKRSSNKRGRSAYFYASHGLREYKSWMYNKITDDYLEGITKFKEYFMSIDRPGFYLTIILEMNNMYYKQKSKSHDLRPYDCSNYIKATEDAICERLGIDDKYDMGVSCYKFHNPDIEGWDMTILMSVCSYSEHNQDNVLKFIEGRKSFLEKPFI